MDPEVYPADGASFAETRAITLSKYLEKELDHPRAGLGVGSGHDATSSPGVRPAAGGAARP